MQFFTIEEFNNKYPALGYTPEQWQIDASCEMIFSQIGMVYRDATWNPQSVPLIIKNASMEQLRFILEHDIPYVDFNKSINAGSMSSDLNTDYSTLALRMLANGGYLYRGNIMTENMNLSIPFGEC